MSSSTSATRGKRAKGLQLHILKAEYRKRSDDTFASLIELHAGAVIVTTNPFFNTRSEHLLLLPARHRLPAIRARRDFAAAGGLPARDRTSRAAPHLLAPGP